MSRTKIAILISIIVLSSGVFVYFNTHQKSFIPSSVHMASDLIDSTTSAQENR